MRLHLGLVPPERLTSLMLHAALIHRVNRQGARYRILVTWLRASLTRRVPDQLQARSGGHLCCRWNRCISMRGRRLRRRRRLEWPARLWRLRHGRLLGHLCGCHGLCWCLTLGSCTSFFLGSTLPRQVRLPTLLAPGDAHQHAQPRDAVGLPCDTLLRGELVHRLFFHRIAGARALVSLLRRALYTLRTALFIVALEGRRRAAWYRRGRIHSRIWRRSCTWLL